MKLRILHRLNTALALLLALLYIGWWIHDGAPQAPLPVTALVAAVLPLALLAPALWQGKRSGATLAGLVLPFHFAFAVMELIANPAVRPWVAVQTFLALLLMTGVMTGLRQIRESD